MTPTVFRRRMTLAFLVSAIVGFAIAQVGATFTALCGSGTACAYVYHSPFGYQTVERIRTNFNDHETRLAAVEAADVSGPSSSIASEVALFDGTTGKLVKRATGSGFVRVTSGVYQSPTTTITLAELPATLGQVLRSSTTLTDAQVKALPTTPINLVTAPGAGLYISLHRVEVQTKFASGAYTNINGTYAAVGVALVGSLASGAAPSMLVADDAGQTPVMTLLTKVLSASSRRFPLLPYLESNPAYVNPGSADGTYGIDLISDVENKTLTISADNSGSGNFTGGNAANVMKVIVFYSLEPVP